MRVFILLLTFAAAMAHPLAAQTPAFREEPFHGRHAYVLENGGMRVSALRGAGHIAEIRLLSDDPKLGVNPMRIPHFPTIDPMDYDPARHDAIYGGGTNRWLQSGYMGHLLNFPTFGPPSEQEAANGLGNHGEALIVRWDKERADTSEGAVRLWYSAHLPKTQYNVGRTLTLPADETVLYIEEWVESLTAFDRPAHWVQHATFGPPFVEPGKTVLDLPGLEGEARLRPGPGNSLGAGHILWPTGKDPQGRPVDLRAMRPDPRSGTYYGVLMDPHREFAYFTMYHPDYRVLIGYVWRTRDFPWVGDWQENKRNTELPWSGQAIARGIEFGTTPFGGPMRTVVEEGTLFGMPVYRWIGGRERVTLHYLAFLTEIGPGFQGVADVEVASGKLLITERETGRRLEVKSARPW